MQKGLFITFEGGECTGKTTIIEIIKDTLINKGYEVVCTREPGGIDIAEQIRAIILNKDNVKMTSETEALLYAASRMQHLKEKVIPALERGAVVLCDRYIDSSYVYQGFGRGLGIDNVNKVNCFALNYLPDLTLFIDIEPEIALKRLKNRDKVDRLDNETLEFHKDVYQGYLKICDLYKDRIVKINGRHDLFTVCNDCLNKVLELLNAKI